MIKVFIMGSVLILTGCSTYKESFDCPVGDGMRCSSLSQVNKAIDRGQLGLEEEEGVKLSDIHYGTLFLNEMRG